MSWDKAAAERLEELALDWSRLELGGDYSSEAQTGRDIRAALGEMKRLREGFDFWQGQAVEQKQRSDRAEAALRDLLSYAEQLELLVYPQEDEETFCVSKTIATARVALAAQPAPPTDAQLLGYVPPEGQR